MDLLDTDAFLQLKPEIQKKYRLLLRKKTVKQLLNEAEDIASNHWPQAQYVPIMTNIYADLYNNKLVIMV